MRRARGRIEDARQTELRLPIRVVWQRSASQAVARTVIGTLRAVRMPWRVWDGFHRDRWVASAFTWREARAQLESLVRDEAAAHKYPAARVAQR